jgi:ParB/RepB/Spo0J family partition protein
MSNQLCKIPLARIMRPKISLRPLRRETPEYMEMCESVRKDGVLQPILVRPCDPSTGYDYEIVEGWHRFEASLEAGLLDIPALIREMSDDDVLIFQLKCNAIRPATRSFEYARRLKILMQRGYTMVQLSQLIDKTPKWISDQLQLNRVCEAARAPIERGEIKMMAALALANLPEDLQEKFVNDAIAMPTAAFKERADAANRDFKAFLIDQQTKDNEQIMYKPRLQPLNVLKRESLKPKYAKDVLKAVGAKTPRDGWLAALQWMFQLDPVSIEERLADFKGQRHEKLATNAEFRKLTRDMIKNFVNPQSSTGDYRNGK